MCKNVSNCIKWHSQSQLLEVSHLICLLPLSRLTDRHHRNEISGYVDFSLINEKGDLLELGPQTLGQSVDRAHTKGRKNPEPNDPDQRELET